jgi:hypothetical protein
MVKLERHSGCSLLMDTEVGSPFEMMKLLLAFKYFCGADINMSLFLPKADAVLELVGQ